MELKGLVPDLSPLVWIKICLECKHEEKQRNEEGNALERTSLPCSSLTSFYTLAREHKGIQCTEEGTNLERSSTLRDHMDYIWTT
eukprot:1153691-Pelagomonas_calceolata.AAC.2